LASENSVRFSGLTLAGPYGFGFAKNPNPIGPDPFRSLLSIPLKDEDEDAGLNPETGEPLLTLEEMLRGDEVSGDEV
jgi:hypothetical protein